MVTCWYTAGSDRIEFTTALAKTLALIWTSSSLKTRPATADVSSATLERTVGQNMYARRPAAANVPITARLKFLMSFIYMRRINANSDLWTYSYTTFGSAAVLRT